MLVRIPSFSDWFGLNEADRARAQDAAHAASAVAGDMVDEKDYLALAAIAQHVRPRRVFEIGTYLGVTSNFFLEIIPECEVVSIAYVASETDSETEFNNSELSREQVGSRVAPANRPRFHQLIGSSHDLRAESMVAEYGDFDLVFIDGDHRLDGVARDTHLANAILSQDGVIAWHDANPKLTHLEVRVFLQERLQTTALATPDDYLGGIAYWRESDADRIEAERRGSATSASTRDKMIGLMMERARKKLRQ